MAEEATEQEETPESETPRALVVFGEFSEGEDDAETLGSSLGREVVVLDPGFLDAEAFARIEEAAAVVIAWDLGTQAGLDVLEALRDDERMQGTPILMSSPEPTQAAVRLAVEAGAAGFLFEPLGAEALRAHLPESPEPEPAPADEDEASAEESSESEPAGEDEAADSNES